MYFVNVIYILLGYLFVFDVNKVENMFMLFCENFESLYLRFFMILNVYQFVYMVEGVRCLGFLYIYSCFFFESKNGIVLKMIRGS